MTEKAVSDGKGKLIATTLLSDQRGAVAFETIIVYFFILTSLLLPLADIAIAGFQFVSAWGALRAFGQYAQYRSAQDVAASTVAGYPISNLRVVCGDTNLDCSPSNTLPPKYYSYTTTVTMAPMMLRSVLCTSGNANPCSFILPYSQRFE